MFDCIVTVPGDGVGRDGRFKKDKTGAIKWLMVDNSFLYQIVRKHVIKCPHCSPERALEHYLHRRMVRFNGRVSAGLMNLALQYERLAALEQRAVPMKLVNEFICRTGCHDKVISYEYRLDLKELVLAAKKCFESQETTRATRLEDMIKNLPNTKFKIVCQFLLLHDRQFYPETERELQDLIQVAEVMHS